MNDLRTTVHLRTRTRIRSLQGTSRHVGFLETRCNVELVLDVGGRGWLRQPHSVA